MLYLLSKVERKSPIVGVSVNIVTVFFYCVCFLKGGVGKKVGCFCLCFQGVGEGVILSFLWIRKSRSQTRGILCC